MKLNDLLSLFRDRRAGVGVLQRLRQAREGLRMRKVLKSFPPLKNAPYDHTQSLPTAPKRTPFD